jgi:IS5 family transposase
MNATLGMKMHIGVDSQTGLVHSAVVTAANVHDKHPLPDLLHGQEQRVWGDSAYSSQQALIRSKAPHAADWTNQKDAKAVRPRTSNAWSTESSPRREPALNMSLLSSNGCGDSTRCATEAWPRTPRDPSSR